MSLIIGIHRLDNSLIFQGLIMWILISFYISLICSFLNLVFCWFNIFLSLLLNPYLSKHLHFPLPFYFPYYWLLMMSLSSVEVKPQIIRLELWTEDKVKKGKILSLYFLGFITYYLFFVVLARQPFWSGENLTDNNSWNGCHF